MMIAAPINPSDVIPITGAYAHRVQPPRVAGYEGLGQVVATSSTSPFRLGQRVLPLRGDGTWQQRLNCNGQWLVPVPEDIADDIALRGYINPLAGAGSADNIDRGRIGLCTSVGTMGAGGRGAGGHRPTPRARARAASAPARYTAADDGPPGRAPPAGGAQQPGFRRRRGAAGRRTTGGSPPCRNGSICAMPWPGCPSAIGRTPSPRFGPYWVARSYRRWRPFR